MPGEGPSWGAQPPCCPPRATRGVGGGGGGPGGSGHSPRGGPGRWSPPPDATDALLSLNYFLYAFLDRLLITFSLNLDPQTRKNRIKMDAKRPPPLDFIFGSLFGRCLLATSTSQSWFFEPPLQPQHVFAKIAFRS